MNPLTWSGGDWLAAFVVWWLLFGFWPVKGWLRKRKEAREEEQEDARRRREEDAQWEADRAASQLRLGALTRDIRSAHAQPRLTACQNQVLENIGLVITENGELIEPRMAAISSLGLIFVDHPRPEEPNTQTQVPWLPDGGEPGQVAGVLWENGAGYAVDDGVDNLGAGWDIYIRLIRGWRRLETMRSRNWASLANHYTYVPPDEDEEPAIVRQPRQMDRPKPPFPGVVQPVSPASGHGDRVRKLEID